MSQDAAPKPPEQVNMGMVLFLVFRPRLTLAPATVAPGDEYFLANECWVDGKHFKDESYGAITDFSDWLRSTRGRVMGVAFWPYEEMESVITCLIQYPYVTVDDGEVKVYFANERQVDVEGSVDQDFLASKVFRSADGEWAIAFRATGLSPADIEELQSVTVNWVTVDVVTVREN